LHTLRTHKLDLGATYVTYKASMIKETFLREYKRNKGQEGLADTTVRKIICTLFSEIPTK
jgi:hypothetical protein